ncbi:MAG: FAD-dependent thymidylate synthase [Candidatus Woesearchaeota archaeon]
MVVESIKILKKPKITLLTSTENPLQAIQIAIDIWHHPVEEIIKTKTIAYREEQFHWLMKQPHQTPLEYFHMVWLIENCSRAFQQQLTRHRIGFSYSIQSLRVVDVAKFFDEGQYTRPSTVKNIAEFDKTMWHLQETYRKMIDQEGEKTEDARGILPLNIHSPITMACTYRSLLALLRQRMCVSAQEEWKEVAQQMREAIATINPIFAKPLDCMCKRLSKGYGFCKTLHKEVTAEEK